MADNKQSSLNYEIINNGFMEKPLFRRFLYYFEDLKSSDNLFRSIDFGQFIFEYYGEKVPKDDADKVVATRTLFNKGFADSKFTDETFVRLMLFKSAGKVKLISFDMIADLVESKAYQDFGSTSSDDKKLKKVFEKELDAELVKIGSMNPVKVVYNQKYFERIIKVFESKDPNKAEQLRKQIKAKVEEFDEIYKVNPDTIGKLKAIVADDQQDNMKKINSIYDEVCADNNFAKAHSAMLETAIISAKTVKDRNAEKVSASVGTNMVLGAIGRRHGWTEEQINEVSLRPSVYERAATFEQKANEINQAELNQDGNLMLPNPVKPNSFKFYFTDIAKTFGMSALSATAFSVVGGINPVAGLVLCGAVMAVEGVIAACKEVKNIKAKKSEFHLRDVGVVAAKTVASLATKSLPFLGAAGVLGGRGIWRSIAAGVVGFRAFCEDIKRRANIKSMALTQQAGSGKLKKARISAGDVFKSALYAGAKAGTVVVGGSVGYAIGSNIGYSDGKITLDTHDVVNDVKEDLAETWTGKLINRFKGLREDNSIANLNNAVTELPKLQSIPDKTVTTPEFVAGKEVSSANNNSGNKISKVTPPIFVNGKGYHPVTLADANKGCDW